MDTIEALKPIFLKSEDGTTPLTWEDVKTFCNSLSEDQLKQNFVFVGEEMGGCIYAIGEMQDDMINPSGDGIEPVSFYTEDEPGEDYSDEEVVYNKGQLFIDAYMSLEERIKEPEPRELSTKYSWHESHEETLPFTVVHTERNPNGDDEETIIAATDSSEKAHFITAALNFFDTEAYEKLSHG